MGTLALDIGGTKISAAYIDEAGFVQGLRQCETNASGGAEVILGNCMKLADSIFNDFSEIQAIGIASAGRINTVDGSVVYATSNLPGWTGMPLAQVFGDRYQRPVTVENDVNAAALGEYRTGTVQGHKNVVCLWLGTGLGGAFLSDGSVLHGAHWCGAELGHLILRAGGRQCNCGLRGCAEQYVSGNAIIKSYNEKAKGEAVISAKEVLQSFSAGDFIAHQVIEEFVEDLSLTIISLSNCFDPDAFVLGGGVSASSPLWIERVQDRVAEYTRVPVMCARLGGYGALIGAAYLAEDKNHKLRKDIIGCR